MPRHTLVDLADCTEFRQTLAARPPGFIHVTVLLLLLLVGGVVAWAAMTEASLVIVASGQVRPAGDVARIYAPAGTSLNGRVVDVAFEEGDPVRAGDVLLRFDTEALDNRFAKLERTATAAREELTELDGLRTRLEEQRDSARARAQAELAQGESELLRELQRQELDRAEALAARDAAKSRLERQQRLRAGGVSTAQALEDAKAALDKAEQALRRAALPPDGKGIDVLRKSLELVDRDFEVRLAELEARRAVKRGEIDAAQRELANLQLERDQAVLRASVDGEVISDSIRPGDILEAGKTAILIAEEGRLHFEARVANEDVGELEVGMPVRIKFDAFDFQTYGVVEGRISFIAPDASPDAATTGSGYEVRIDLDSESIGRGDENGQIKLGMGGTAEIVVDRETLAEIMLKQVRHTISLN
ncbi:Type I secretion system membrane fusion protein PrsE [Maioricimonas rarisocia]|uniref:Type I secretion system membrane fusion protein PrsE n=1 Tax=Maioricimonas rarisocia TaxID=2528026 RepID=A0A517ZC82_9PLAN|nr:HlyD family efflux transporter periplasmic adaptor subunit [Maioricimonas rarisocia]QDU40114.1 Type I secretion system membrane fusion protein PrsE [Maioricimonas rarisocia]